MTTNSDGMTERRAGTAGPRLRRLAADVGLGLVGFAAFLALWWAAIAFLAPPTSFLARFAPDDAFSALVKLLDNGRLLDHIVASLRRILVGLGTAVAVGIPLGLALGSFKLFGKASSPLFQFVRMISPLSWTPLAIILFGVGDEPVYFLIAIGAVWPVVLNTAAGVATLDPGWVVVGRSLGATRWEIVRHIVWPGIRADVLTGLRLAVGLSWIILVPAEMLGVDSGLGYFILDTRDRFAYGELVAAIIVIGVLGFVIDGAARWLLTPRRKKSQRASPVDQGAPSPAAAGANGVIPHAGEAVTGRPERR